MEQFIYDLKFQRSLIKLLCTNMSFAQNVGILLNEDFFESQPLRNILTLAFESINTYGREIDYHDFNIKIDEYVAVKGYSKEALTLLREELKMIYAINDIKENFITDVSLQWIRRQKLKQAFISGLDILKKDGDYEQILKLMDNAISIGSGMNEGYSFNDLYTLPQQYKKFYDPSKLIKTGFHTYDRALDGGMGPGEVHILAGPAKSGKCLKNGTKVLMADGSLKKVEDIVIGDKLLGVDGFNTVLGTNKGRSQLYQVIQNKGITYEVNGEHLLYLRCREKNDNITITTEEAYKKGNSFFKENLGVKTHIKYFPFQEISLDPYFLGVWLGDGCNADQRITNPEPEILDYLQKYSKTLGLSCNFHSTKKKCPFISMSVGRSNQKNIILESLRSYNLINNKHIPSQYLINTEDIRLQVLAGLIDTDGSAEKGRSLVEIITKYENLRDDILFLCRSLGFRANYKNKIGSIKKLNFEGNYFRILIAGDFNKIPNKVKRKKIDYEKDVDYHRNPLLTGIKIEKSEVGDWSGFQLDGDELFLLEDFTVTHNSTIGPNFALTPLLTGKAVFHISLEISALAVLKKYAARITGLSNKYIFDDNSTYEEKISRFQKYGCKLFVNFWPLGSITTLEIRAWISRIRSKQGISPDLIIIDYDDCLRSTNDKVGNDQMYLDAGNVYTDLKQLAEYFKCPILTFAQTTRNSWEKYKNKELISCYDIAHSAKKIHLCDSISTINFTPGENEGILYVDLVRRGESYIPIPVRRDYDKSLLEENPQKKF